MGESLPGTVGAWAGAEPKLNGAEAEFVRVRAFPRSTDRTRAGKAAAWVWTCLLKMASFGLGLHQDFTISYLDPTAPTQAFLSMVNAKLLREKMNKGCLI